MIIIEQSFVKNFIVDSMMILICKGDGDDVIMSYIILCHAIGSSLVTGSSDCSVRIWDLKEVYHTAASNYHNKSINNTNNNSAALNHNNYTTINSSGIISLSLIHI